MGRWRCVQPVYRLLPLRLCLTRLANGLKLRRRVDVGHLSDGDAHVDANRPPEYEALSRQGTLGQVSWPDSDGEWRSAPGNPLYGCMRQIAYEVDQTIAPLIQSDTT